MDKPEVPKPKKRYSTPKLTTYGTIEKLTEKVGLAGQKDGGKPPAPFKTGFH
jgi:hypothetical protein